MSYYVVGFAASSKRLKPASTRGRISSSDWRTISAWQSITKQSSRPVPKIDDAPEAIPDSAKARSKMKSSEDKYRVMVDTIPALVRCTLPDGSNEFHNQRSHDYTGLPEGAETGWG